MHEATIEAVDHRTLESGQVAAGQFDKLHLAATINDGFRCRRRRIVGCKGRATEGLTRLVTMLVPWRAPFQSQESVMFVPPVQSECWLRKKHAGMVWQC